MNELQQIVSMTIYGNVPITQIPATVKVFKQDGSLFSTLSYDVQGRNTGAVIPSVGLNVTYSSTAVPNIAASPTLLTDAYADIADLKTKLGLSQITVTVQAAQSATWGDPCNYGWLGGQTCTQILTPGYTVSLLVNGVTYEYHHYMTPGVGVTNPLRPKVVTTTLQATKTATTALV
jgi:hypothetical protein